MIALFRCAFHSASYAAVRRDHAAGPEVGDGERDLRTGVGERLQILLDLLALITAE